VRRSIILHFWQCFCLFNLFVNSSNFHILEISFLWNVHFKISQYREHWIIILLSCLINLIFKHHWSSLYSWSKWAIRCIQMTILILTCQSACDWCLQLHKAVVHILSHHTLIRHMGAINIKLSTISQCMNKLKLILLLRKVLRLLSLIQIDKISLRIYHIHFLGERL